MTTEKHNHEYCKILCAEDVWNMTRDELFMWQSKNVKFLKETYTEAFHALIDKQKLEAKNASLTLQNEALREAISTFNKFARHRPTIEGKVEFFRYLSKSARERGQANADSEVWEDVANLVEFTQQPTPDPDKISKVVKSAIEINKCAPNALMADGSIVPEASFLDALADNDKAVEAYLNDKKGN